MNHHDFAQEGTSVPRGKKRAEAASSDQFGNGGITKWEAVKATLTELGNDTMPQVIREHVKTKYGLDMHPNLVSNYKSNILKKSHAKKRRGRPKASSAGAPAKSASAASGISLADVQAVKELVDRMGQKQVRELAQVLAK